ncbi:hypothetical protein AMECASPLE_032106 [Ameca splendens]|uniref:Uncharacterized protein n=1 Tax=Ameca splendens TaxID=208324 RepID=A0ABV0XVS4_9TELE
MAGSQDDSKDTCGRQDDCSISAPILENSTKKSEASIHILNPPPYSTFATSKTPVNSSSVSHSLYPDVRALPTLAAVVNQDLDTGVFTRSTENRQHLDSTSSARPAASPKSAMPADPRSNSH